MHRSMKEYFNALFRKSKRRPNRKISEPIYNGVDSRKVADTENHKENSAKLKDASREKLVLQRRQEEKSKRVSVCLGQLERQKDKVHMSPSARNSKEAVGDKGQSKDTLRQSKDTVRAISRSRTSTASSSHHDDNKTTSSSVADVKNNTEDKVTNGTVVKKSLETDLDAPVVRPDKAVERPSRVAPKRRESSVDTSKRPSEGNERKTSTSSSHHHLHHFSVRI